MGLLPAGVALNTHRHLAPRWPVQGRILPLPLPYNHTRDRHNKTQMFYYRFHFPFFVPFIFLFSFSVDFTSILPSVSPSFLCFCNTHSVCNNLCSGYFQYHLKFSFKFRRLSQPLWQCVAVFQLYQPEFCTLHSTEQGSSEYEFSLIILFFPVSVRTEFPYITNAKRNASAHHSKDLLALLDPAKANLHTEIEFQVYVNI